MEINLKKLISTALEYQAKAYAPYSHFNVGAAVETERGDIVGGFNIENASFGASNCAERTAMFSALQGGAKRLKALAVVGNPERLTYPCGICRQVMAEFCDGDMPVIVATSEEDYRIHSLAELLPGAFSRADFKGSGSDV